MNVKVNKEISNLNNINTFRVNGSGSDESLSIGACYAYAYKNNIKVKPLKNLYLGYQEDEKNILKSIQKLNKKILN